MNDRVQKVLKIKEEFASVPTAYGAFLQETSNPTFVNGKYYKIIVIYKKV